MLCVHTTFHDTYHPFAVGSKACNTQNTPFCISDPPGVSESQPACISHVSVMHQQGTDVKHIT